MRRHDLVLDLVGADVDVRVVGDEVAHARQAGQDARQLVAVQHAVLGQAQRQLAVRAHPRAVDERRLGAVHRLEAERLVLGLDEEHVVAVEVPVARLLPQLLVHERRRVDLLVAAPLLELAHGVAQRLVERPALGVPERATRATTSWKLNRSSWTPSRAVVALLGLLAPPQELVELLLRRPDRAVDALERRRASGRPASRRPTTASSLNGPILPVDSTCGPAAQVDERAVLVERRDGRRARRPPRPRARGRRGSRP